MQLTFYTSLLLTETMENKALPLSFVSEFMVKPHPFAGSNVVGQVAEKLKRRWISIEINETYVAGSAFRFEGIGKQALVKWNCREKILPHSD